MQSGLRPSVVRLYDPLDSLLLQWGYAQQKSSLVSQVLGHAVMPLKMTRLHKKFSKYPLQQILQHPQIFDKLVSLFPVECLLILGFEGEDKDLLEEEMRIALRLSKQVIFRDLGESPGLHWLRHRYSVAFKMPVLFKEGNFVDTIEVAATWDKILSLYENVRQAVTRDAMVMAHFSHAYHEGCSIYFTFVGRETKPDEELKRYDRIWDDAMQATLKSGGTISHNHGIGILKSAYMRQEMGDLLDLFRDLKKRLDPQGIMNPGKLGL